MIVSTPAVVLSTLRYGETSKIVRLATRDHGVQSAIAKGASRPRSRFGAGLQLLSAGQAHLLMSERRDLHTLTGFDLANLPVGLAADVRRYATGTALAELVLGTAGTESHPEVFAALMQEVAALEHAAPEAVPAVCLRAVWHLVATLGFTPSLDACARDGADVPRGGSVAFSAEDGGVICATCARGAETTTLPPAAREDLARLLDLDAPLPALDARHAAAHRRLLVRHLRYHVAEGAALPALDFWQERAWTPA